jgi:hypothetical protein
MQPNEFRIRAGHSSALLLLLLLLVIGVTAAEQGPSTLAIEVVETRPYGTFDGIEYVEHDLVIAGPIVLDDGREFHYRTRGWIWAPADPEAANGRALVEPVHPQGDSQFGSLVLGDLLYEQGFVRAAIRWALWTMLPQSGDGVWASDAAEASTDAADLAAVMGVGSPEQQLLGAHALADFTEALRHGQDGLKDYTGRVDQLYSIGYSFTGAVLRRLLLDPLPDRHVPLFDGSLVIVAGAGTLPISLHSWSHDYRLPDGADTAGRVIALNSESELLDFFRADKIRASSENYRSYETVGAHLPLADFAVARNIGVEQLCTDSYRFEHCGVNLDRWWFAARALFLALDRWAASGAAPPDSRHLHFDTDDPFNPAHFDVNGNRLGGIRSPAVEVGAIRSYPVYLGSNLIQQMLAGNFFAFQRSIAGTSVELDVTERYQSHDDYIVAISDAVDALVGDGFMLERDASAVLEQAAAERNRWLY